MRVESVPALTLFLARDSVVVEWTNADSSPYRAIFDRPAANSLRLDRVDVRSKPAVTVTDQPVKAIPREVRDALERRGYDLTLDAEHARRAPERPDLDAVSPEAAAEADDG